MTDQTAFEYCDEDGDRLTARPTIGTPTPAILLHISPTNCARVRLDRVEEVVAGIRDAARQADGQPAADCPSCEAGIEHTEHCPTPETHNWGCGCPTDQLPVRRAQLATPCAYCGHTYNWHSVLTGCQVTAGEARCGCRTFVAPAAGLAAPTNHNTETEEDARHELYDYATITFHETGIPESVHAYVTRLIATYRTAILTAAADKAEAVAIRLHNAGETTASNGANEAMSALRRLAAGAES